MGFNDARRGVMGYYDLARDARLTLTALKKARNSGEGTSETDIEITLWTTRLQDLGIRVTSALVEMEDLEGAARHLRTLSPISSSISPSTTISNPDPTYAFQKALLWLYLGDLDAARGCFSRLQDGEEETQGREKKVIKALSYIADSDPASAIPIWEELISEAENGSQEVSMYKQNLAVCHLYLGDLSLARKTLQDLVEEGNTFHALTFNLSTIYELCTESSRGLKIELAEKVASMRGSSLGVQGLGWEKVNGNFKL